MSLRVDLMRPAECRYQGPVSRRFAGWAVAGFFLAVVLLWIIFSIQQGMVLRREVANMEREWADLEPRFKAARAKRVDFQTIQGYQREIIPWGTTRVDWAVLLDELNAMVPANIQLTRLNIRSNWELIKPQLPKPADDAAAAAAAKNPPLAVPARRYFLSLNGRAAGDTSEEDVRKLANELKSSRGYSPVFETIRLQNLIRDARQDDSADRSFAIEGQAMARKLE